MKRILNSRPIFYCFLILLLSILSARFLFYYDVSTWILVVVILTALIVFMCIYKKFVLMTILVCTFLFGIGWYFVGIATFEGGIYNGSQYISGRITDDIKRNDTYTNFVLDSVKINGKKDKNILLVVYGYAGELDVGDNIEFEASLDTLKLFNLGTFNTGYFRDKTAYRSTANIEDITKTSNHKKFDEKIRLRAKDIIYSRFDKDNGALAYAILFGDKNDIEASEYKIYKDSGVLHLLTVSGLHITFLINLIGFILKLCKVKGKYNFLITAIFLAFYSYVCGFTPSVLRAGIMGLVLLACTLTGKWYDGVNSLGFAGIVMLIFSPLSALDAGFLMSYGCVFGILFLAPVLGQFFKKFLGNIFGRALAVTISAQISTMPFLASFYSSVNILSFITNIVTIPLFAIVYPIFFVSTILCLIMPFLSFILVPVNWLFVMLDTLFRLFSRVAVCINLKPINLTMLCISIAILFVISRFVMLSLNKKAICICALVFLLLLNILIPTYAISPKKSVLYSYQYGQGIVVMTNSDKNTLVVDGGIYGFANNALGANHCRNLAGVVSLNSNIDEEHAKLLRTKNVFYHQNFGTPLGNYLIEYGESVDISGFKIEYLIYNNSLIGVNVAFDEEKVFVIYNRATINESILEYLKGFNFDFIFVNKAKNFENFKGNGKIVSYKQNDFSNFSYEKRGSVNFVFSNGRYKLKGVD